MPYNVTPLSTYFVNSPCPEGYELVGDVCIKRLTETIEEVIEACYYDFKYFEIGGEMVGRYVFGSIGDTENTEINYFGQGVNTLPIGALTLSGSSFNIEDSTNVILSHANMSYNMGSYEITLDRNADGDEVLEFSFGEFFTLTNSPNSIYRLHFSHLLTSDYIEQDIDISSALTYKLGIKNVDLDFLPRNLFTFNNNDITPTIKDPVSATDGLVFDSLTDSCYNWVTVADGSNFSVFLSTSFNSPPFRIS